MKYPRTPHLPWSPGATADDVRQHRHAFEGAEVVVTEKLDGENTTLLTDRLHARSLDSAHHPSRTRVKALHGQIGASIPQGFRICGENVAARHSLPYDDLLGWFYAFSVWDDEHCLDWDATVAFAHERGLPTPTVLYRGPWDPERLRRIDVPRDRVEGYVVRTVAGFGYAAFGAHVAKWVRPDHVQTQQHWMHAPVVWNELGPDALPWTLKSGGPVAPEALRSWLGRGEGTPWDFGGLGEARLEGLIASQLLHEAPGPLLPELVPLLGMQRAVRVVHLVQLHQRPTLPVDDATREGGLVSLARATDLRLLHGLAAHRFPEHEQVAWSRLHAEEAGLWARDPLVPFRRGIEEQVAPEDAVWAVSEALVARSRGKLRSPEEALAWLHPRLGRPRHTLTLLVGPSGCGKSTLVARDLGAGAAVVSLDALRDGFDKRRERQVLARALERLEVLLPTTSVVWDATCLVPAQRALPLRHAEAAETRIVSVVTAPQQAAARNARRERPVPEAVVQAQWSKLRWPLPHEAHRLEWVDANE